MEQSPISGEEIEQQSKIQDWSERISGWLLDKLADTGRQSHITAVLESMPAFSYDIETFDEEMEAWKTNINSQLVEKRPELDRLRAAVAHILFPKLGSFIITPEEEVNYSKMWALKDTVEQLESQAMRAEVGIVEEFIDATDLSIYSRYIPRNSRQLGTKFNRPRHAAFSPDPLLNAHTLNRLPFIHIDDFPMHPLIYKVPAISLHGRIDFPLERIIGVQSFASWAGRGEMGDAAYGTLLNGRGSKGGRLLGYEAMRETDTSRAKITAYAHDYPELIDGIKDTGIEIIRDGAGEYWGISNGDGSHRLAAAKLRGEDTFPIYNVFIHSDEVMRTVPFSVTEVFSTSPNLRARR